MIIMKRFYFVDDFVVFIIWHRCFCTKRQTAVRNRALGSVREVLTARELDGSSEVIERRLERETMRERGQNIPAERQYRILVRKAQQLIGKLPDEDSKNEYIEKLKVIENTRDSIGNKIGRLEGFINELKNIIEDRIIVDKEVTFRGSFLKVR